MTGRGPIAVAGWESVQSRLLSFLDSVGADNDAHTVATRLLPIEIASPAAFEAMAARWSRGDGEWSFVTTSEDDEGRRWGYALPVTSQTQPAPFLMPLVEIHSTMTAWFLTYAWRARQLSMAGLEHFHGGDVVAAAACVRPLVETAAALFVDGRKVRAAWNDIKQSGPPEVDDDAFKRKSSLLSILNEVTWGAKFDDKASEVQQAWAKVSRTNVMTHVEKLAKAAGRDIQYDYQWLCNTVHPSIGNTFAFSSPPLLHDSRTHVITYFAGRPIQVTGPTGNTAEDTVERAIVRGATLACQYLTMLFDAALRTIDDLALTSGAPGLSRERYWRQVEPPERNKQCPCRSGRKYKLCRHAWGDLAPGFPQTFDLTAAEG